MNHWKGSIRSGVAATITLDAASGKWDSHEVIQSRQSGIWPVVPGGVTSSVRYLVVGGGGGGGTNGGGGGGAGGLVTNTSLAVTAGTTYPITVGAGGAGGTSGSNRGTNGSDSQILINNSYSFNGTSQYLTVTGNAGLQLGTGDFTFETWIYLNSAATTTARQIFSNWGGSSGSYQFFLRSNLRFCWQIYTQNSPDSSTLAITPFTWTHIAVCRSGTTVTTFFNGRLVDTTTGAGNSADGSGSPKVGANYAGSEYFPGSISNLRIVKGVAVYTGAFAPSVVPLTVTQSSGTNITAITGTQTSLLLGGTFLIDSSTNALTITNTGSTAFNNTSPFYTGFGGGGGASRDGGGNGANGGSGGGGADGNVTAGIGISGQGNSGGAGGSNTGAGGGGGAGAVGGAQGTGSGGNSGNGGIGLQSDITGTATYYAGGGGGQRCPGLGSGGASGGLGGGGTGAGGASSAGTANTGGGGGGDGGGGNSYTGGSGVVILSYPSTSNVAASTTGSPTVTIVGGNRIYKWTASGSITF
jgi:hypothetical protein